MPPATAASITSLTVVPYARLIVRRSSSGRWVQARRRSGESCPLSTLAGAARSSWLSARVTRSAPAAACRGRGGGRARRAQRPAQQVELLTEQVAQPARQQPLAHRVPAPRASRRARTAAGSGVGSSSSERELDRREAVDHAVMGLADDREAALPPCPRRSTSPTAGGRGAAASTSPRRRGRRAAPAPSRRDDRPRRRGRRSTPARAGRAEPTRASGGSAARAPAAARCDRGAPGSSAAGRRRAPRTPRPSPRACARSASPPRGTTRRAPTAARCSFRQRQSRLERAGRRRPGWALRDRHARDGADARYLPPPPLGRERELDQPVEVRAQRRRS